MYWHVYSRAGQCPHLSSITLATDDSRISKAAREANIPCLMTSQEHQSGTDRVIEAMRTLNLSQDAVVINIQGDEPTIHPAMLTQLIEPFVSRATQVTTLARQIGFQEAQNPNTVKVVWNPDGRALYFSRSVIPYSRERELNTYWAHIGLYGFRVAILERFAELGPSCLEQIEKLEQLRLLEANIPLQVVPTSYHSHGVDTPQDLKEVEAILSQEQTS
jgi:3-deoxy-manno-octulosonate cytidylyltransferase (CMP-KDO synthetase)